MGNFSSKDGHGPTGAHTDIFHTPPTSPVTDVPILHQLPQSGTLKPPPVVPVSSPVPTPVSTGKKTQSSSALSTSTSTPTSDLKSTSTTQSNSSSTGPVVSPVQSKPGGATAPKGQVALEHNGCPTTSTPKSPHSQGKTAAVSPAKTPLSQGSASPVVSPSGQSWRERDSGLSHSLSPGHGPCDSQGQEMEKLLEECRSTLGIAAHQDGSIVTTTDTLKHLLSEVKSLKSTMQTERGEWLQFQADLQVAVAVADRLRAEAEEELTALRTAHKDLEHELVAAQQRQKETDAQLLTLRAELQDGKQRLATLSQVQGKAEVQATNRTQERPGAGTNNCDNSQEGPGRGRQRGTYRAGRGEAESESQNEGMKNAAAEEAKTDLMTVTKRYLRNVTNDDRQEEKGRSKETRRTAATERSRSLNRLPMSSDSPTVQNGTSQSNTGITPGSTNKNPIQTRGQRSFDWQDSRSSTQAGKHEESLNKYNSALTELPPTKSQDGFNLLLRRHGGSKRNSLLRWCQSRTQGYKNIDITNFSSSWADGLAFCALYHTYLPSHIPYCTLSPESKRENLNLAFKTGENVGITQSLTVEEMLKAGGPDWQRVLSYVESMYRHFEM
ncbi:cytospin-A isoform X2 [Lampris incognitus]|uniref:cytospin-A isoform X2 n=1 Tax=Lampris incognitus TaxID=2546036 RepID=UPI0024B5B58F|nr:cytospin-A isoform X2 [Lampris incognitus]